MKLAVLICTYNPKRYLIEQLESILIQVPNSVDIFIYDDSEYPDFILGSIKEKHSNRVNVFSGPKKGHAKYNFIYSLKQLYKYDWVFLSDQDDIWCNNKYQTYLQTISSQCVEDVPYLIFSDASIVNSQGRIISDSFLRYQQLNINILDSDDLMLRNCAQGATFCINKKIIHLIQLAFPTLESIDNILMHDWWVAIVAKYFGEIKFIDKPLLKYRQHDSNEVGAKSLFKNISLGLLNIHELTKKFKEIELQLLFFYNFSYAIGYLEYSGQRKLKLSKLSFIKLLLVKLVSKFMNKNKNCANEDLR